MRQTETRNKPFLLKHIRGHLQQKVGHVLLEAGYWDSKRQWSQKIALVKSKQLFISSKTKLEMCFETCQFWQEIVSVSKKMSK